MATARPGFICNACARSLRLTAKPTTIRHASTGTTSRKASAASTTAQSDISSEPRWKRTPPRMKMPVRLRPMPEQPSWDVNESQEALDKALDSFIGNAGGARQKGSQLLPEEVKWLAVTHKTFEQGARGFNDRLALLGKRILDVQVSKALLNAPLAARSEALDPTVQLDKEEIIGPVERHPDLEGVENLSAFKKQHALAPHRVAQLAEHYGVDKVARWVPRKTAEPERSGRDIVLSTTMYAILGAIALQHGGEVANTVAKERMLDQLGL